MTDWKIGRGWPKEFLLKRLLDLRKASLNFDDPFETAMEANGWNVNRFSAWLGREEPGPPLPDGPFQRMKDVLHCYDFSDPSIVEGHFDPRLPLLGREMLLEFKVHGLRFLNGVRVVSVTDRTDQQQAVFGFCYATLEGHIEKGYEQFHIIKDMKTGCIRLMLDSHWKPGEFPTWWSRIGFNLLNHWMRKRWFHRAENRLRRGGQGCPPGRKNA